MAENSHTSNPPKIKPIHYSGDIWLVPCVSKPSQDKFEPKYKPLDIQPKPNEYLKFLDWTDKEDKLLVKIIQSNGAKKWDSVAQSLNKAIHKGLEIRKGRQCRGRWQNYLDPSNNKDQWSQEEDSLLIELQKALGNKWKKISKRIAGRSESAIRRRWMNIIKLKKYEDRQDSINDESLAGLNDDYRNTLNWVGEDEEEDFGIFLDLDDVELDRNNT